MPAACVVGTLLAIPPIALTVILDLWIPDSGHMRQREYCGRERGRRMSIASPCVQYTDMNHQALRDLVTMVDCVRLTGLRSRGSPPWSPDK